MRTVLGVIVALLTMVVVVSAVSVAPWLVLGVDAVLKPGGFDTTTSYTAIALVAAALGGLIGGGICSALTRSRTAVYVLAVFALVGGMTNVVGQARKPQPGPRASGLTVTEAITQRKEPMWFTLVIPCLGVLGVLRGGQRTRNTTG